MRTLHTKTFLIEAQRRKASYKSKEVGAEYKMDKANLTPFGSVGWHSPIWVVCDQEKSRVAAFDLMFFSIQSLYCLDLRQTVL